MILCVIQARLNSTRLPKKVLRSVNGKPLLKIAYEKAVEAFGAENVVVAYPATSDNLLIAVYLHLNQMQGFAFMGDENDLLARFVAVGEQFNLSDTDILFRYTPDDHLKEVEAMKEVAGGRKGVPVEIGGEAWMFAHVKDVNKTETDPFKREHVTYALTGEVVPPVEGMTIDTAEDLMRANA